MIEFSGIPGASGEDDLSAEVLLKFLLPPLESDLDLVTCFK